MKEIIHYKFVPPKHTVSQGFCFKFRMFMWLHSSNKTKSVIGQVDFIPDSALPHIALLVKQFLAN